MDRQAEGARYLHGYSLGVSGVVAEDGRAVLVRQAAGPLAAWWTAPGGFVHPGELIDEAVRREVLEETGLQTEVAGVLGVRNRLSQEHGNNLLVIFLLKPSGGTLQADGQEIAEARWVSLEEVATLPVAPLSRLAVELGLGNPGAALQPALGMAPPPGISSLGYTAYSAPDSR